MTRDVINAIPAGTKSVASIGVLIPGVVDADAGRRRDGVFRDGHCDSRQPVQRAAAAVRRRRSTTTAPGSGGNFNTIVPNDATVQEVSLEVGGTSAESPNGGLRTNIIPRDGGNTFKGFFFGSFTDNKLQAGQPERFAQGARARVGPSGHENLRHRSGVRRAVAQGQGLVLRIVPEAELAADRRRPLLQPDADRPRRPTRRISAARPRTTKRTATRACALTWQINPKNKLSVQGQNGQQKRPYYGYALLQRVHDLARSDLLFRVAPDVPGAIQLELAGDQPPVARSIGWRREQEFRDLPAAGHEPHPAVVDGAHRPASSGGTTRASYGANANFQFNTRLAASYVTGSHAAKFGITFMHSSSHVTQSVVNNGVTYQLNGGARRATA